MSKIPKTIQDFGRVLEYPVIYGQLIANTVAIYKSKKNYFKSEIKKGNKPKIPKHPRTLISECFLIAKNRLSEKFLTEDYFPTEIGMERSTIILGKEFGISTKSKKRFLPHAFNRKLFGGPFLYGVAIGDYIDCEYQDLRLKVTKKGSANHSCPSDTKRLRLDLKDLRSAMDESFSCNTAYGDCNTNSMASGHCMLSSLIIQDLYGGDIKSGTVNGIPHYWNSLCHIDVDLTGDQFNKPAIQIRKGKLYGKAFVFGRDPFETMDQNFNKEVWNKHCKFRKDVTKKLKKINKKLGEKLEKSTHRLS